VHRASPIRMQAKVCSTDPPHQVVVYRTPNFSNPWEYLGVAYADHVMFRPHVARSIASGQYVMWHERQLQPGTDSRVYSVATAEHPAGPFTLANANPNVTNKHEDYNLMLDDDGTGYHVSLQTLPCWSNRSERGRPGRCAGLIIQQLTPDLLWAAAGPGHFLNISGSGADGLEAPIMFKNGGWYYVTAGTLSCAAGGGTNIFVWRSKHPLGPYTLGSTGAHGQIFDRASSRAQGSTVFTVGGEQVVWLGNQWLTSTAPNHSREHDLLRWATLEFTSDGLIKPVPWTQNVTIMMRPSGSLPSRPEVI